MKNIFERLALILLAGIIINLTVAGQIKNSTTDSDAKKRTSAKKNVAEDWFLETEGRIPDLFIHEVGIGEPVIVIHGGPGAGHRYMTGIARGLENQFRFIFYDQRGVGYSFWSQRKYFDAKKCGGFGKNKKGLRRRKDKYNFTLRRYISDDGISADISSKC